MVSNKEKTKSKKSYTLLETLLFVLKQYGFRKRNIRFPRVAVVGRRGSGKTTLLNTLFNDRIGDPSAIYPGKADLSWKTVKMPGVRIFKIMEVKGFQISQSSNEYFINYLNDYIEVFRKSPPDILLFLVKATEVNAAVNGDLAELEKILRFDINSRFWPPPILVVITQCDQLDPCQIKKQSNFRDEWTGKLDNISIAISVIRENIYKNDYIRPYIVGFVPIATYVRIKGDGSIDTNPLISLNWNINRNSEVILDSAICLHNNWF